MNYPYAEDQNQLMIQHKNQELKQQYSFWVQELKSSEYIIDKYESNLLKNARTIQKTVGLQLQKGARLVSAVTAIIKMIKAINIGICPLKIHQPVCCDSIICEMDKSPVKITTTNIDKPALNS